MRGILKGLVYVYFYVGVNVIGLPSLIKHEREVSIEGEVCDF